MKFTLVAVAFVNPDRLPCAGAVTMENVNGGRLGFTSDGIVAYEYDTQDWTLTPLGSTVASQRLHVGRMDGEGDDVRIGWSYSGGYSCVYTPRTRVLSKVVKWWN